MQSFPPADPEPKCAIADRDDDASDDEEPGSEAVSAGNDSSAAEDSSEDCSQSKQSHIHHIFSWRCCVHMQEAPPAKVSTKKRPVLAIVCFSVLKCRVD